jgi:hypothetical protein
MQASGRTPATPTRSPPSLAGIGATGAMAQIASERASMDERAQQILDVLGRAVVPQGRVDLGARPGAAARITLAATGDGAALHATANAGRVTLGLHVIGLNHPLSATWHTDLPMRPRRRPPRVSKF